MRKLSVLPVALAATAVVAAPAAAQDVPETTFNATAKITPQKVGTPKKPQPVRINGSLRFRTITQGVEPPIITGGDVLISKGGSYNGGRFPTCSMARLRKYKNPNLRVPNRRTGKPVCPPRSIMGRGSGVAYADRDNARPEVVFINGGKSTIWIWTTLYRPALVREPIRMTVRKLNHRKWGYRASFKVPEDLQIVAAVPITLRSFNFAIGSPKTGYITTTSCPRGNRFPYEATAHYLYEDGTTASKSHASTVACRR